MTQTSVISPATSLPSQKRGHASFVLLPSSAPILDG